MKKIIFLVILILAVVGINNYPVYAQDKRLKSSPQSFQTFFRKFKNAIGKNDKTAIALMTFFPFKYGFDTGDEGEMTKTQFLKNFDKRFAESFKQIQSEDNPLISKGEKGGFVVSTEDAAHFSFIKSGTDFKFVSYIVEP